MKLKVGKSSRNFFAGGALVALLVSSQGVMAGQYSSEVKFPYIYASGQTHRVNIPFSSGTPDGLKVKSVSWSWRDQQNGQRYNVKLCQMVSELCKDISFQKTGSSRDFGRIDAAVPFYFLVTGVGRPFNPESGLTGSLTVSW